MRGFRASRAFKSMAPAKHGKQDHAVGRNNLDYAPAPHHQGKGSLPAWLKMPEKPQLKLVASNGKLVTAVKKTKLSAGKVKTKVKKRKVA